MRFGKVAGYIEYGNEYSDTIKRREFVKWLGYCYILKDDFAVRIS
jgi:hypothetical protein